MSRSQPNNKRYLPPLPKKWGKLDFLLHSISFAPKEDLQGRVVDNSSASLPNCRVTNEERRHESKPA